MKKVAFFPPVDVSWMGGANYYKNILHAINVFDKGDDIAPHCFVGSKTPSELVENCYSKSRVVRSSLFDRWSLLWFLSKASVRLFKKDFVLYFLLRIYKIDLISHAVPFLPKTINKIGWIPDFQHVYLPEFFSQNEIDNRNKSFFYIVKESDLVFLSSNDALSHYKDFFPSEFHSKAYVLRFVSQVDDKYFELDDSDLSNLVNKYGIEKKFFYIPNQIWKHKNHKVLLDAGKILKGKGVDFCFVCTGHKYDYRTPDLYEMYEKFILENHLSDNFIFLDSVPYSDVMALIRFSSAVINPSLFEGWSSTVEECKSAGKHMILSDIPVHREQYPNAVFFEPTNAEELSHIVENYSAPAIYDVQKEEVKNKNNIRTYEYFKDFLFALETLNKS